MIDFIPDPNHGDAPAPEPGPDPGENRCPSCCGLLDGFECPRCRQAFLTEAERERRTEKARGITQFRPISSMEDCGAPEPGNCISEAARQYRDAKKSLEGVKAKHFPRGKRVEVNCPRYRGDGVVVTGGQADEVAVRIPNGNTWHYPIEAVKPK